MARSQNTVSLPGLLDRLRQLSKHLDVDKHIQRQIEEIAVQFKKCVETLRQSLSEKSDRLYKQGELLKQAREPKDVDVKSLQKILTDTRKSVDTSQTQITELQESVHKLIETCQGQVNTHKSEQDRKQQSIDKSKREINDLNDKINRNEEDARDLDRTANGRDASKLRDDITEMNGTVEGLKAEKASMRNKIAVLEDAIKALQNVTSYLKLSDEVLEAIQDMDFALKDALQTSSEVVASQSMKRKRTGGVEEQMKNLRDSWDRLQTVMTESRKLMQKK